MTFYPVILEPDDNGTLLVSFPDIPEAHTFGDDEAEALARAVDALVTALEARIKDREPIPAPSAVKRQRRRRLRVVSLPPLVEAKVRLYATMRAQRIGKAELARRLHVHLPQVDRLLTLRHQSRLDQLDAALRTLGKAINLEVVEQGSHAA